MLSRTRSLRRQRGLEITEHGPREPPCWEHVDPLLALGRQLGPKEHKDSWAVRASFLDKEAE